jgi:hypothetical protein
MALCTYSCVRASVEEVQVIEQSHRKHFTQPNTSETPGRQTLLSHACVSFVWMYKEARIQIVICTTLHGYTYEVLNQMKLRFTRVVWCEY